MQREIIMLIPPEIFVDEEFFLGKVAWILVLTVQMLED